MNHKISKRALGIAFLSFVLLAFSCTKVQQGEGCEGALNEGDLRIEVDGKSFAATGTDADNRITSLGVYVFDEKGAMEWTGDIDTGGELSAVVSGLTPGVKSIEMVANCKMSAAPSAFGDVGKRLVGLGENSPETGLVMYGKAENVDVKGATECSISLKRLCAKISLSGAINCKWPSGLVVPTFSVSRIYLENACGEAYANSAAKSDCIVVNPADGELTAEPGLRALTVKDVADWTSGSAINGGVDFYSCPAPEDYDNTLKMVIEALYNGRTCFYHIDFPKPEANTKYSVNFVTICRIGADEPDGEIIPNALDVSLAVEPWVDGGSFSSEF